MLIALALVVVFRSSSTINFAQGEFALFTSFVAWWLDTKGLPMLVAMFVAMVGRLRDGCRRRAVS